MALIRISSIKPGQIVSDDVKDRSGRILLAAQSELTDESIKILKSWGVVEVPVLEGTNASVSEVVAQPPADGVKQQVDAEISSRFRFLNLSHPFIAELYSICSERKLAKRGVADDN